MSKIYHTEIHLATVDESHSPHNPSNKQDGNDLVHRLGEQH